MGKAGSLPDKTSDDEKTKTAAEKDKENMPAPGQPGDASRSKSASKKAKVSTVVLHPTAITQYIDLAIKASTPAATPSNARRESHVDGIGATPISATGPRPQTPLIAIPSTPHLGMDPPPAKRARREKMELDGKNIYTAESQIKLATTAPLYLEPVESASQAEKLLEALSHPEHSSSVPQPKTRKKTVAEMAAEESAAADEEQYMLILDERYNTGAPGGANPVDGDGQVAGASFEPRFERFKAIDSIKLQVEENKKREKIRQAEAIKKQHQEQEAREKANAEAKKRQQEEDARRQAHIQLQQQQMRQQAQQQATETIRRQQAAIGQSQNAQNQQAMKGAQAQNPHGHPAQNMGMQNAANGMNATQHRMMQQQQQFSQAQASSPIVRNATPHNVSSPMVASNLGIAMQQSTSSMGGSPPRPASVVQQNHQMTPALAHAMRAQGSQQSHGGTPRMPNATPQMAHGQMNQTPRMSQASPIPGHMIQTPQMGAANMMPNGQIVNAQMQQAQIIAQQQHQQRLRQQQAAQMGSSPIAQQQMASQQFMQAQQMAAQQHMAQQQQPGMMAANPITAQYAAQMRAMVAAQAQNSMQQSGQNFMAGKPQVTPQMIQQAQQQAQHQAALQQAQQPMPGQQQQAMIQNQIQQLARQIYHQQLPAFTNQWNGNPPPEAQAQYRQNCTQQAQMKMRARMQAMQQNSQSMRMQQQMMVAQQQGMAGMGGPMNGMNGGMNGMGMQRPPGM
jgi:transcription factor SPT20